MRFVRAGAGQRPPRVPALGAAPAGGPASHAPDQSIVSHRSPRVRRGARRWAALALAAVLAVPAAARAQDAADSARANPTGRTISRPETEQTGPLLDAPVSRTAYALGPGDQLNVAILGTVAETHVVPVSPEGAVLIPGLGSVRVLGLNLEEAEARIRSLVARYYIDTPVAVTLARVRTFRVFVAGDVPNPGVRTATAATRVSEVVPQSSGNVRRRNVTLRRASGETIPVDLIRFLQTADVSANPFLREGDAVVIPPIDQTVNVVGRVYYAGAYEYRPGESLQALLHVVNGGPDFPVNAADSVRVGRVTDRGRQDFVFTRAQALGPEGRAFLIQPFDWLFISEIVNYRVQTFARVTGQVQRPGAYPIRPDTTTLRDLVAMAGGFTPQASLAQATVRRVPAAPGRGEQELLNTPDSLLTRTDRRIDQTRQASDVTLVSVDVQRVFAPGGGGLDLRLRTGDVVDVPERRNEVLVLGAVGRPGIVPADRAAPPGTFVQAAGGLTRRADWVNAVVIRANGGARLAMREVSQVEPGDVVVVPFRRETTWGDRLRSAGAVISAVTGVVFTLVTVF